MNIDRTSTTSDNLFLPVSLYLRVFIKGESPHCYFKWQNDYALFHS